MKFDYLIYVVSDNHGHKEAVTADEHSDPVQICGMKDPDGKKQYFESEAYHLTEWCEKNGLELNILNMDTDV